MRKLIFLAVTGIAVAGLTLATPAVSRADHRRGTSIHVDLGGFHFDYNRGRGSHYRGGHYGSGYGGYYTPGYGGYSGYGPGYGGYYAPRQPIVIPMETHWTPYRGWHTHGEILVPHRGHYHARPY